MATLYISYFGKVHEGCAGMPLSCEAMTTSTTSAQAAADIPAAAAVVALSSSADHYVTIGAVADSPVAGVGAKSFFLPANTMREIRLGTGHESAATRVAAKSLT